MFGYVKGAFTGANESRAGFFQTADGGTILLDEVNEMSIAMQVKLLRVLQDKQVCMVGDRKSRKVDVRIIASSNKDLRGLVNKGVFREDLFFRLNVVTITVPPLRNRPEDIADLIAHFTGKFADELGKNLPTFSDEVVQALMGYAWPGNIRELENLIQRLIIMTDGQKIEITDLPSVMRFPSRPVRSLFDRLPKKKPPIYVEFWQASAAINHAQQKSYVLTAKHFETSSSRMIVKST